MLPWWLSCKESARKWETRVWSLSQEDMLERKWQPTLVFLPGKSREQRTLAGYSPWGCKSQTWLSDWTTTTTTSYLVFTECSTVVHRCHQGLVPGPTVDTKICKCSSPKVSLCVCEFGQLAIHSLIVFCPPLMASFETALPSAQHSWLPQDVRSRF